jgi:hypothetical protein
MMFAVSASFPRLGSSLDWDLMNQATAITNKESGIFMSTGIIVVIVVAVIVVGVIVFGVMGVFRRRRLQQRFGPEYDRVVGESGSRRAAEAELAGRERRVQGLDIQPLTDMARAGYAGQWTSIQEQFVDAPADAVSGAQILVVAVMTERGYPVEQDDQVLADLSVGHSGTLDRYRAAKEISGNAAAGATSTEDLRQAMVHYHALFADLLGEPAVGEPADSGPAGQGSEPAVAAESTSQQFNASDPEEMAK